MEEPPDKSPVDSWEGLGDSGGTTPEGDEEEDSSESEKKKKSKKIVIKNEDDGIKKEHINVIFIGHVGMFNTNILCS